MDWSFLSPLNPSLSAIVMSNPQSMPDTWAAKKDKPIPRLSMTPPCRPVQSSLRPFLHPARNPLRLPSPSLKAHSPSTAIDLRRPLSKVVRGDLGFVATGVWENGGGKEYLGPRLHR